MLSEADVQFINKYALFAKLIDKAINQYNQIIKTSLTNSKHHSKTMQESGLACTLRKDCQTYIQQMDGKQ